MLKKIKNIIKNIFKNPLTLSNGYRIISIESKHMTVGHEPLELIILVEKNEPGRVRIKTVHLGPKETADFLDMSGLMHTFDACEYKRMNVNATIVSGIRYNEGKGKNIKITFSDLNITQTRANIVRDFSGTLNRKHFVRDGYMNESPIIEYINTKKNETTTKIPISQ